MLFSILWLCYLNTDEVMSCKIVSIIDFKFSWDYNFQWTTLNEGKIEIPSWENSGTHFKATSWQISYQDFNDITEQS